MSDHKPVTAEELAEIERLDREATPGPWKILGDAGRLDIVTAQGQRRVARLRANEYGIAAFVAASRDLLPRLARDLATARASIRNLIESLNTAQTDRDAIGDRCLDLGRELEALRAAVRVHEERRRAGWPTPNPWNQADLDLWAAGKA